MCMPDMGLSEQAVGGFPLGLGLIVEDRPSELSCIFGDISKFYKITLYQFQRSVLLCNSFSFRIVKHRLLDDFLTLFRVTLKLAYNNSHPWSWLNVDAGMMFTASFSMKFRLFEITITHIVHVFPHFLYTSSSTNLS